jgi:hypothetical protein
MGTHRDGDLARLSAEILRYLESHRDAADTVEGIARWWIKRQRLEDTLRQVQWALDRLVADARIEVRVSPAGRTLYQLRGRIPDAGQDAP